MECGEGDSLSTYRYDVGILYNFECDDPPDVEKSQAMADVIKQRCSRIGRKRIYDAHQDGILGQSVLRSFCDEMRRCAYVIMLLTPGALNCNLMNYVRESNTFAKIVTGNADRFILLGYGIHKDDVPQEYMGRHVCFIEENHRNLEEVLCKVDKVLGETPVQDRYPAQGSERAEGHVESGLSSPSQATDEISGSLEYSSLEEDCPHSPAEALPCRQSAAAPQHQALGGRSSLERQRERHQEDIGGHQAKAGHLQDGLDAHREELDAQMKQESRLQQQNPPSAAPRAALSPQPSESAEGQGRQSQGAPSMEVPADLHQAWSAGWDYMTKGDHRQDNPPRQRSRVGHAIRNWFSSMYQFMDG